jgi:hypothetical protein
MSLPDPDICSAYYAVTRKNGLTGSADSGFIGVVASHGKMAGAFGFFCGKCLIHFDI